MFEVKNLVATIDDKYVLNGLNLKVNAGEVHAIMGPNGSGKSSLSKIIAGHPDYQIVSGDIQYEVNGRQQSILDWAPDLRAKEGIFLAFQYPIEVAGVSNTVFLKAAFDSVCKHQGVKPIGELEFDKLVRSKAELVGLRPDFLARNLNEGFSGGEKKRNEILQMAVLAPRLAILDETDSGLDIDALKAVAAGVNKLRSPDRAIILITHYQRLLDFIVPDYVHILASGKIIKSGDKSLALDLEKEGYAGYV